MSSPYYPQYGYPPPPPEPLRTMPRPPGLHWGWLVVLSVFTLGLFNIIWLLVQSNWVRKVRGTSRAFWWSIAYIAFLPGVIVFGFVLGLILELTHSTQATETLGSLLELVVRLGMFVLYIVAVYTLKGELEASPISIPLGGVMTFFFGAIYFQYHLHSYDHGTAFGAGPLSLSQPPVLYDPHTAPPR